MLVPGFNPECGKNQDKRRADGEADHRYNDGCIKTAVFYVERNQRRTGRKSQPHDQVPPQDAAA